MENKKGICRLVLGLDLVASLGYIAWRIGYTIPRTGRTLDFVLAIIFLLFEVFGIAFMLVQLFTIGRGSKEKAASERIAGDYEFPDIDVYVYSPQGDRRLIANTVNACHLMDYPDKGRLHIIPVEGEISRINELMAGSSSQLVAIVEAGMLPRHEFLVETVSLFVEKNTSERLGFVQCAVGFFNPDSYQFRLFSEKQVPNELKYFQDCQMPVFNDDNAVVCCGTGAVFSKKALESIGGFDAKGVAGYNGTGLKLIKGGYVSRYINKRLVSGFFDCDIASRILRQKVKVTDALDAMRREHVLFTGRLNMVQKLDCIAYIVGTSNVYRSLVNMLVPALCCIFGVTLIAANPYVLGLFWLFIYICSDVCIKGFGNKCTSLKWRRIYSYSIAPYLIIPCIRAFFGAYRASEPKSVRNNKLMNIRYLMPHILLLALNAVAFVNGLLRTVDGYGLIYLLFTVWAASNIYFEIMSLFWVVGRPYVRQEERVDAHVSYQLTDSIQTICGMTRDLTSRSISIWCDKPYDIDDEELVRIKLSNGRYQADMEGRVIGAQKDGNHWKYVVLLQNMENFKQQYYGILYDRNQPEVQRIDEPQNIFNDIRRNLGDRFGNKNYEYRKMIRIPIDREVETDGKKPVFVKNYNYKYFLLHSDSQPDEYINLKPCDGIVIRGERIHRFGEHMYQYRVLNYGELRVDNVLREKLYDWMKQCCRDAE
jgi:cellulose synthase (UDP-forming)